jgi:glycine/D-amino acid oxidase-like deaminating enzyme
MQNNDTAQARPLDWGLWGATASASPATTSLSHSVDADVVVIGAGYTGLSAALHLAQAGRGVTVLEAHDIGSGGSGRNVGLVNAGLWLEPQQLIDSLAAPYGRRLLDFLGQAPAAVFDLIARLGIDCDAVQTGTLHCAVGRAGFKSISSRASQWQALGAPVELLDARQSARKTGSDAFAGCLLDRRAGTLQPLSYARGIASAAARAGASIFTRSPAIAAAHDGSRWRVATPAGSVSAAWLIAATDAYSTGPWHSLRREQVHLPYFNLATLPLPAAIRASVLPERQGAWDTQSVLTSFRLDRDGRLVFGSVGALSGTGSAVHQAWARRAVRSIYPALHAVKFEHAWYGMIGMTHDALPRLHQLGPRALSCSGYNGRGIAPGTVFGRLLASYILGSVREADLPLPLTAVREARLRPIREWLYDAGSQLAHALAARGSRPRT